MKKNYKIRIKKVKNKVSTCGYFIKRLRDCGFIVIKIFSAYAESDPRRWTVLVDPSGSSIYITCYSNRDFVNQIVFEINDGGQRFPKNYNIITDSIEVIVNALLKRGITTDASNTFLKNKLNNNNAEEK